MFAHFQYANSQLAMAKASPNHEVSSVQKGLRIARSGREPGVQLYELIDGELLGSQLCLWKHIGGSTIEGTQIVPQRFTLMGETAANERQELGQIRTACGFRRNSTAAEPTSGCGTNAERGTFETSSTFATSCVATVK